MSTILHNEIFDKIYADVLKAVDGIEKNLDNFMDFLVITMERVENTAKQFGIHGLAKKELVVNILAKFFADVKEEGEEAVQKLKASLAAAQLFADRTIDILVSAAKGQLHFNEAAIELKAHCGTLCVKKSKSALKNKMVPKDVADVEALTNQIYDNVKASIVNKTFGVNNIVVLFTIVMQVVEQVVTLSGPEKKQIAISVIQRLVQEIPMPDDARATVAAIVNATLSKTIDYIIMAANGELDFGKIAEQVKGFFTGCCKKPVAK